MNYLVLALFFVSCSSLKISPFVPEEMTRQELDIAKTQLKIQKREIPAGDFGQDSDQSQSTTEPVLEGVVYTEVMLVVKVCRVSDDTDDTVPIVVGCVLAALIAVVMISYFVIRARANRK